jgi:hypothetical protein
MTPHRRVRTAASALALFAATTPLAVALPIQLVSPPTYTAPSGNAQPASAPLAPNPLSVQSPPLNGFIPQVVFGLTDQQDRNTEDFAPIPSSTPTGTLPLSSTPQYQIAIFDTGAQSHLINYAAVQAFNFESSGRVGTGVAEVIGASGSEPVNVSDALGIYMTTFANATATGSTLSVTPGSLTGQWNTSILSTEPGSSLPNLIGAPMAAQYQTVIRNSQTRHLTVGTTTHKSPSVTFQPLNTPPPDNSYVRLTLDLMGPAGVSPNPAFIPSLDLFNLNFADNPSNPSFWAAFFAKVSGTNAGNSISNEQFLFDTGAEVTVLSQDTAASLGYYSAGPNASTPDFTVEVSGVGGTQNVPGFFLPQLSVMTNGGPLTWTDVPVLVLDVIDPRDGVGFAPGILGTNLFSDRDLIINGGTTNPSVSLSPRITPQWTNPAGGSWTSDANWSLGYPSAPDQPANFLSAPAAPTTVTLSSPQTAGSLTFDNAHPYALTGPGPLTLQSTLGSPAITVLAGHHTIATTLALPAPATLQIAPSATLDITTNTLTLATPADTIRQYLLNNQLTSSTPDPTNTHSLAYLDTGTHVLVKLTLTGDANVDGLLTPDDYALLDKGFATNGSYWHQGDFNYDGQVTSADYLLVDATLGKQQGGHLSPNLLAQRTSQFGDVYVSQLLTAIPEPSAVACLFAILPLLSRSRRFNN